MGRKKKSKSKSLDEVQREITRKFGELAIFHLGKNRRLNVDSISTGMYGLDRAIGVGGLPCGRIIELHGAEATGKSSLCLTIVASVQKRGKKAVYIDAEHAIDTNYAARIGVNFDDLLFSQPDYGEQALSIVESLIGNVDLIVVDSVANLIPKAELERDIEKDNIGLQARMMSRCLRKLVSKIGKSKTVVVFINQVRDKIGSFIRQETTPGGRALKFSASVRIRLRHGKRDKSLSGQRILGSVVKNKVASPYEEFSFIIDRDFRKSRGVLKWVDFLETAIEVGLLEQKKNGIIVYRKKSYRGLKTFWKYLASDKKRLKGLREKLKVKLKKELEG